MSTYELTIRTKYYGLAVKISIYKNENNISTVYSLICDFKTINDVIKLSRTTTNLFKQFGNYSIIFLLLRILSSCKY